MLGWFHCRGRLFLLHRRHIRRMASKAEVFDLIAQSHIFDAVDAENFHNIVDSMMDSLEIWEYPPGFHIIDEAEDAHAMYFILKGTVEFFFHQMALGVKQEGECFGEIGVLMNCPRTCTAIAKRTTQTLVLLRDDFLRLVDAYPGILQAMTVAAFKRFEDSSIRARKASTTAHVLRLIHTESTSYIHHSATSLIRQKNRSRSSIRSSVGSDTDAIQTTLSKLSTATISEKDADSTEKEPMVQPQDAEANSLAILAKVHKQRLLFNYVNRSHDGQISFDEFSDYVNARGMVGSDISALFEEFNMNGNYHIDEKEFCIGIHSGIIDISSHARKLLKKQIGDETFNWYRFGLILGFYLTLPVSMVAAAYFLSKHTDHIIDLNYRLECLKTQYRLKERSITSSRLRATSEQKTDENEEKIVSNMLNELRIKIATLEEMLTRKETTEKPIVLHILDFIAIAVPRYLSPCIQRTLDGETTSLKDKITTVMVCVVLCFAVSIIPLGIIVYYYLPIKEELNNTKIASGILLITTGLFVWLNILLAGQSTLFQSDGVKAEIERKRRKYELSLVQVDCDEVQALTAEDIYDWILFVATHRAEWHREFKVLKPDGIREWIQYLLCGSSKMNSDSNEFVTYSTIDGGFRFRGELLLLLAGLNAAIPILEYLIQTDNSATDQATSTVVVSLCGMISSALMFWIFLKNLMMGKDIYARRLRTFRVFSQMSTQEGAKLIGVPFLELRSLNNVIAWTRIRQYILQDEDWQHQWIEWIITMSIGGTLVTLVLNVFGHLVDVHDHLRATMVGLIVVATLILNIMITIVRINRAGREHLVLLKRAKWAISSRLALFNKRKRRLKTKHTIDLTKCMHRSKVLRKSAIEKNIEAFSFAERPKKQVVTSSMVELSDSACIVIGAEEEIELQQCMQSIDAQIEIINRGDGSARILGIPLNGAFIVRACAIITSFVISAAARFDK